MNAVARSRSPAPNPTQPAAAGTQALNESIHQPGPAPSQHDHPRPSPYAQPAIRTQELGGRAVSGPAGGANVSRQAGEPRCGNDGPAGDPRSRHAAGDCSSSSTWGDDCGREAGAILGGGGLSAVRRLRAWSVEFLEASADDGRVELVAGFAGGALRPRAARLCRRRAASRRATARRAPRRRCRGGARPPPRVSRRRLRGRAGRVLWRA